MAWGNEKYRYLIVRNLDDEGFHLWSISRLCETFVIIGLCENAFDEKKKGENCLKMKQNHYNFDWRQGKNLLNWKRFVAKRIGPCCC